MSRILQTFLSYKYLKDAAGVNYLVVNSLGENPVISIKTEGKGGVIITSDQRFVSRAGTHEIVITYTGSGKALAVFKNGQTHSFRVEEPTSSESLPVPFSDLKRSFTFKDSADSKTGYDISDALYYNRAINKQLVIFPESANPHLDTSSKQDFYYLSSGSTAYIASTTLQNQFLNDIKYTNRGSEVKSLGKFRGGFDDNSELSFTATPQIQALVQPKIRGAMVSVQMMPRDLVMNFVCLDPTASNYYLLGCQGQVLPCSDSGVTHANDCQGIALNSQRLNDYPSVSGGCCEYTSGCDGYSLSVGAQTPANTDTANGTIDITVTGGTANFTAVVDAISLDNSTLTYNTATTAGISTSTFTISSLFPGSYAVTVTDSTSGTCTDRIFFTIREDISDVDGTFGCKSDSSAINYDSSVGTHDANACVFCNATTGQLEAGSGRFLQVLGPVFEEGVGTSVGNATSSPSGTSQTDGTISFAGVNYASTYTIFPPPNSLDFDPAVEFDSSNQASPIDYKLYKLNGAFAFSAIQGYIDSNQNALTLLTANSTLITTVSGTGSSNVFTGLAAGEYAVVAVYDNDGTQDGDDEVEQCYTVFGSYIVGQGGCMSPNSPNYNPDATFDDGSCIEDQDVEDCTHIRFGYTVECVSGYINIDAMNLMDVNSNIQDAATNGFIQSTGVQTGFQWPGGNTQVGYAGRYIWWNLLCYGLYNPTVPQLPGGAATGSPFNISTDGVFRPGTGAESWMLYINSVIVMADGTEVLPDSSPLVHYLNPVFTPPNLLGTVNGAVALCDYIANHGIPSGIKFSYNYGTADVWEETYEVLVPFTNAQISTMLACCQEEEETPGCTDPTAINYNPAATVDDGSCLFDEVVDVLGCTDPAATNFNPLATIDDGSCEYFETGSWVIKTCNTCEWDNNVSPAGGYATEADCLAAATTATDCCLLEEYSFAGGGITTSATQSSSIYNATTGLCDDLSTGSVTFTLPDATSLLSQITNPNGIAYSWVAINSVSGIAYGSWFTGSVPVGSITPPQAPYDTLNSGVGANQISLTGIPTGVYQIFVSLVDSAFVNGNGEIDIPLDQDDHFVGKCGYLQVMATVGIEDCDTNIIHGCTDPNATNYLVNCQGVVVQNANVDDGCCEYISVDPPEGCLCPEQLAGPPVYDPQCCPPNPICGCMDPNASNYNPNANFQDATCPCDYVYNGCIEDCDGVTTVIPGCIPNEINKLLEYNSECIARSGNRFYTKHITGLGSDCSTMETWKMIIIQDLMSRQGLPCIYNCADESTRDLEFAQTSCKDNWINGGSQFWSPSVSGSFTINSYVRRPYIPNPNNLAAPIYVAISNTGLDIDPFSDNPESGWKKCVTYTIQDESKDYLSNFLSFAKDYCRDCGIPAYRSTKRRTTTVLDNFNVGGTTIEVNGSTFDDIADQSDLTTE